MLDVLSAATGGDARLIIGCARSGQRGGIRVLERDDRVGVAPVDPSGRCSCSTWCSSSLNVSVAWLWEPVAVFEIVSEEWLELTAVTVVPEGMPLPEIVEPTVMPATEPAPR